MIYFHWSVLSVLFSNAFISFMINTKNKITIYCTFTLTLLRLLSCTLSAALETSLPNFFFFHFIATSLFVTSGCRTFSHVLSSRKAS